MRVTVHYGSDHSAVEQTLARLKGSGHIAGQANITDADAAKRMVADVAESFGRIDKLVNSDGVFEEHPLPSIDYPARQSVWRWILSTNLVGAANPTTRRPSYDLAKWW